MIDAFAWHHCQAEDDMNGAVNGAGNEEVNSQALGRRWLGWKTGTWHPDRGVVGRGRAALLCSGEGRCSDGIS